MLFMFHGGDISPAGIFRPGYPRGLFCFGDAGVQYRRISAAQSDEGLRFASSFSFPDRGSV
jgi:hypothetical protein